MHFLFIIDINKIFTKILKLTKKIKWRRVNKINYMYCKFIYFLKKDKFNLYILIELYIVSGEGKTVSHFFDAIIFFLTSGLYISANFFAYSSCWANIFLLVSKSPLFIISFSSAFLCKNKQSSLLHSIPFKK